MYTWVMYDITDNKMRLALSKQCKHLGLFRVQKSIFLGKAQQKLLAEFEKEAPKFLNDPDDKLFIVPMHEDNYKNMKKLGLEIKADRLRGKVHTLFF
jgi:CRISPR-associated protein Cas2